MITANEPEELTVQELAQKLKVECMDTARSIAETSPYIIIIRHSKRTIRYIYNLQSWLKLAD